MNRRMSGSVAKHTCLGVISGVNGIIYIVKRDNEGSCLRRLDVPF